MRFVRVTLWFLFVLFGAVLCASAQTGTNVDPSKRAEQLSPSTATSDTPLSPDRETNQRTFFRNEYLQEQRYHAPEMIERRDFVQQDKRAPIEVTETRGKNLVERKEYPRKPEVKEHVQNQHDGEKSRIQPKGDFLKRYDTVSKYQDRIADAKTAAAQRSPSVEKRTTFEKLNRFVFRRNGPGAPDGSPIVTPAAGGAAPTSLSTYTKYRVDWKRIESPSTPPPR